MRRPGRAGQGSAAWRGATAAGAGTGWPAGDGGHPGRPVGHGRDGPRHDQHGAVGSGSKVKLPNASGPEPRAPTWSSVTVPSNRVAQPFFPGRETVLARGQCDPRGFAPAHQPGALPYPSQSRGRRRGRNAGEQVTRVRDGHGAGGQAPGLRRVRRGLPGGLAGRRVIPVWCHSSQFYGRSCNGTFAPSVYMVCAFSPRGPPRPCPRPRAGLWTDGPAGTGFPGHGGLTIWQRKLRSVPNGN